jgi:signal transduction histidine kinase
MTFAKKIFIAVFLSMFLVGSILIWSAHKFVESNAEADFTARYTAFSKVLADALTRLDTNTEALMMNAAKVVVAEDKASGLLSTDELRRLQRSLNVTHLFVIDSHGRFIRSTNEDPAGIPNLFSFSPVYKKLLSGESDVEATPVIKPNPEPKPFKFLSVANADRTRIIEVGVRLDFIANTLVEAVGSDKNLMSLSLFAPDGTTFGTFAEDNVVFESQKANLPSSFEKPIDGPKTMRFYTRVRSSHPSCNQCEVSKTSVNGEYYYVLESTVSKAELLALQSRVNYLFLIVGILNALFSFALARILSRRLVRSIESAVSKVRAISESEDFKGRIGWREKDELSFLTNEFDRLLDKLDESKEKLIEAEKIQTKVDIARVVAHNIRSPIIAIEMMLPSLSTMPERVRKVLTNSVSEIKELSNKLKAQADSASSLQKVSVDNSMVFLPTLLQDLVQQKELESLLKLKATLKLQLPEKTDDAFARVPGCDLRGVLSNIINNAFESYGPEGGEVSVSLKQNANGVRISVADKGSGIPAEYLADIGKKAFSFKGSGNRGVGFMHAYSSVELWGGCLSVQSAVSSGTTVEIFLPRSASKPRSVSVRNPKPMQSQFEKLKSGHK